VNKIVMSTEYFPCVAWMELFLQHEQVFIEQFEYFERASFRNRCLTAGVNGIQTLSIPIAGGRNQKCIMKNLRVCYDTDWMKLHWKTIYSNYKRSAFFDYFEDELNAFFQQKHAFVLDWNLQSLEFLIKCMNIKKQYALSDVYTKPVNLDMLDARSLITMANYDTFCDEKIYWQTFNDRHDFQPNLSCLDLLFCEGASSVQVLLNT
jgi:hypothetical protein